MKKILIVLFILLFSSCINFDEDINKSNDSTIKEKISANSISSEKKKRKDQNISTKILKVFKEIIPCTLKE